MQDAVQYPRISIVLAEHQRRTVKRFIPPSKFVVVRIRPSGRFEIRYLHGYKDEVDIGVTFKF
jgi:hypothetical protein